MCELESDYKQAKYGPIGDGGSDGNVPVLPEYGADASDGDFEACESTDSCQVSGWNATPDY